MTITKAAVRDFHKALNQALVEIGTKHDLTFQPGNLRFSDTEIAGRVRFVAKGKEASVANRSNVYAVNGHKVGDTVTVRGEEYVIEKFTPRGGSHITRTRDGKRFRCSQMAYESNGKAAGVSEAQIRAIIRQSAPGLNANAVKRMLGSMRWETISKPLTTVDQVQAWVAKYMTEAEAEAKKHPVPGTKWDATRMLNDSADEIAWEARVS